MLRLGGSAGVDLAQKGPAGQREDRPDVILAVAPFAISGAVAGFFLAGHIALSIGVFGGIACGCVLGWWARGLSGKDDAG